MELFTKYNTQTGNRGWTSKAKNIHVGQLNRTTKDTATILSGIDASKKSGNTTGIITGLWDNLFGSGSKKQGGGVSGFFGNLFGGTGEEMIGKASLLNVLGAFVGGLDKTQEKLDARRIDVQEKIGMGQVANQKLLAESNIRRAGMENMYMGWSPKQADDPGGIFKGTPGLVVGDAPTQVASTGAGIIGGNNQGLITEAQQRQLS